MQFTNPKISKRRRIAIFSTALALAILAGVLIDFFESRNETSSLIGSQENVILLSPQGPANIVAKTDTGADFSAIDSSLADRLGLQRNKLKRRVISASGVQVRETVNAEFILGDKTISSVLSVADRSQLNTDMIIGRQDLLGFTIDPARQFLNEPKAPVNQRFSKAIILARSANRAVSKDILIIPILGALVVLFQLIGGLRTFGVFAPVVIALSLILMSPNIVQGIFIYIFLISIGTGFKIIFFEKLKLPHVAEMSLIMSAVVLSLVGFSFLPLGFQVAVTTVFFPLIITTHIIERFSKTVGEHRIGDAILLTVQTMALAVVLTFIGSYLITQSYGAIWLIFAASILLAIAAGHYNGLRFTEFFRFKMLRKK
ncbi:MAG: 7TM domain-containing protein [Parcubacteria group bacterium]|jgi:hypothetical protein